MSLGPAESLTEVMMNSVLREWSSGEYRSKLYGLLGTIVENLESLQTRFPEDEDYNGVSLSGAIPANPIDITSYAKGFDIYSIQSAEIKTLSWPIAYGCKRCEKIIIGSPRIEPVNFPTDGGQGVSGWEYHCTNCNHLMYRNIFARRCF